jgi:hypothetical protein
MNNASRDPWLFHAESYNRKNVLLTRKYIIQIYKICKLIYPSGFHASGYGKWRSRGTRATQCPGREYQFNTCLYENDGAFRIAKERSRNDVHPKRSRRTPSLA